MQEVVIIGGGATGAIVALHLDKVFGSNIKIKIIEKQAEIGLGKAYSTRDHINILNVPVERMSAFPDDPHHFLNWLTFRGYHPQNSQQNEPSEFAIETWPFVPRKLFGLYLQENLQALFKKNLTHLQARAKSIQTTATGTQITLDDGKLLDAPWLVIATGYEDLLSGQNSKICKSPRVLSPADVEKLDPDISLGKVLIVGMGLTAVDLWRRLRNYPETQLHLLSRRGLLPLSQVPHLHLHKFPRLAKMSPRQILSALRFFAHNEKDWANIADHVRHQAQKIWSYWTVKERKQFIRHVKPYWEVIRHRLPAIVHQQLQTEISAGSVRQLTGRILNSRDCEDHIEVTYFDRHSQKQVLEKFDHLLVATGSSIDQNLLKNTSCVGLTVCPHGYGYSNEGASQVWLAGPTSKSRFWEMTAIPEIRTQASSLAQSIKDAILSA